MIQQISLCLLLAVGIAMVTPEVSNAWHRGFGSGSSRRASFGGHFRHRPTTYRQYEFGRGYWCHSNEYERMRAMYGFTNL
jgi:hypothetical protein